VHSDAGDDRAAPDEAGATAVAAARAAVSGHVAGDEREAASQAQVLDALDRLDRPFDRYADLTHVTGSAVVIGRRGVVLHRHKRLGRWMQPGGHIDPGESPEQAALREAAEETGLAVRHFTAGGRLVHVDVHPAADEHVHLDLRYLMLADDDDPAPGPAESPEVAWFTWPAALDLSDPSLRGALQAAAAVVSR
jgi:8-oxo-dGTP pyrophosphatase MutT (NUDIX family)